MIQVQQDHKEPPRFYAYCECGVCGPLRVTRDRAVADDAAHADVCSGRRDRV